MAYVSAVLILSAVPEVDPLFLAIWQHLLCRYPGAYTPKTSMFAPLGPDYSYFSSIGRVLKRRDIDAGKEGGYGNQYIKNSSLGYQTRVGIDWMNNSIHNLSNLDIAHPSPGVIRMNTHIPSSTHVPRPRTLAVQKPPTHQEDHILMGERWSNPGNLNPPLYIVGTHG